MEGPQDFGNAAAPFDGPLKARERLGDDAFEKWLYTPEEDWGAAEETEQQALEAEGYETSKMTQSLRFYDAVIERQPDLILLDLMMPYLEGEDELRLLKMNETTKQIPAIVVTERHEAKQEAASNGANDFKNDVTQQAS